MRLRLMRPAGQLAGLGFPNSIDRIPHKSCFNSRSHHRVSTPHNCCLIPLESHKKPVSAATQDTKLTNRWDAGGAH